MARLIEVDRAPRGARFEVRSPDGAIYDVTGPAGATEQEAIAYVQQMGSKPKKTGRWQDAPLAEQKLSRWQDAPIVSPGGTAQKGAVMDLSKLSDSDLQQIAKGDLRMVSEAGLKMIAGEAQPGGVAQNGSSWLKPESQNIDARLVKWDSEPANLQQGSPVKIGKDAFPDTLRQVLRETDWGTRNIASAGTALTNLWEGAKQLVGRSNQDNIRNQRIIREEAPVGGFVGDVAMTATPFKLAGPSLKAAGAVGAGYGLSQPVEADSVRDVVQGKAINTVIGGASAAAGQAIANKASSWLADKTAKVAANNARREPLNATVKEALDAGYTIPPGNVKPTFANRQLESMGGKIATQQMAAMRNQAVTDALARKAAGLADDAPITPESLKAARDVIKQPYEEIAGLGLQSKLDALDAARSDANAAWREYSRQGTRQALKDFGDFKSKAAGIEKQIESTLFKKNRPDLMRQFNDARVALAKNHDVETALIEGGGSVDARAIARMFQRGDKMTGELKTIGAFANNFPKITQPEKMIGTPDAHNLRWLLSLGLGGGGAMSDDPRYAAIGLLPFAAGPAARSIMFSRAVQQGLLSPATVGKLPRLTGGLLQQAPAVMTPLSIEAANP